MKRNVAVAVFFAFVLATGTASAKSKEKVFDASFDSVWSACVKAASAQFVLEHSDKESGVLTFKTGVSLTSWGFSVGVIIEKLSENKTKVTLNPQKKSQLFAWGAGDRIANKFFKDVQKALQEK